MVESSYEMGLCKIPLAVVVVGVMGLVALAAHTCGAQNSPQDYLDAHNAARAEVGVGPMTWNNTVAAYAQNYTKQRIGDCNLVHSGGQYGESLAKGTPSLTGTDAVNMWVGEKPDYDCATNACAAGKVCGQYTQVVWFDSTSLGCARVQCNNGWWFVICNYDPPGNYIGQRPYSCSAPTGLAAPAPAGLAAPAPAGLVAPAPVGLVAPAPSENSQQDFLDAHNAARAEVGVGDMAWDDTVAAYAQNYADQRKGDCNLVHSNGPYGENLAKATPLLTATEAVNMWVAEKPYYDYASNTCAAGKVCGHYTQVVWRNSTRLGCARVQCNDGWWFVICNYDPPGNYIGQRPFCSPAISEYLYIYEII